MSKEANQIQKNPEYICWIKDINFDGIPLVGGKNASLGEMYRELTPKGAKIPNDGVGLRAWNLLSTTLSKSIPWL